MRHVDVAIGTELDVIAAMAHATFGFDERLTFFKDTVAIGIGEAEERLRVVGIREERAVRIEQPPALQQFIIDDFHLLLSAAAECETQQAFLFFAQRDAALGIEGHRHPGVFTRLRRADQLRFETRRQGQRCGIGRLILRARFGELPGVVGIEGFL